MTAPLPDLALLRKLAEAAMERPPKMTQFEQRVFDIYGTVPQRSDAYVEFQVAADPQTIIALLDRIEQMQRAIYAADAMREFLDADRKFAYDRVRAAADQLEKP